MKNARGIVNIPFCTCLYSDRDVELIEEGESIKRIVIRRCALSFSLSFQLDVDIVDEKGQIIPLTTLEIWTRTKGQNFTRIYSSQARG